MPTEFPLWPDGPTYTFKPGGPELTENSVENRNSHGLNRHVSYVSEPTLTYHPAPPDTDSGAAIIVAPGGGNRLLALDKEGHDIAEWLNKLDVAAFVLKYRTRPDPDVENSTVLPAAVHGCIESDGIRAVRTVRARASEWGLDPARIGMMGFSAGSRLTAWVTFAHDEGNPNAADPIERVSAVPDFVGLMYGARAPIPEVVPPLPPMFVMQANDDPLFADPRATWLRYCETWSDAGAPYEVHHYARGGHGFGMGVNGGAVAGWPRAFGAWLRSAGVL